MIRLIRFYLTQRNRFHYYWLKVYVWALRKCIKEVGGLSGDQPVNGDYNQRWASGGPRRLLN